MFVCYFICMCMYICVYIFILCVCVYVYTCIIISIYRHLAELQTLQNKQKKEIEELYKRLGKTPPSVVVPPTIAMAGARRRPTKGKGSKSSRTNGTQASSLQQGIQLTDFPFNCNICLPKM